MISYFKIIDNTTWNSQARFNKWVNANVNGYLQRHIEINSLIYLNNIDIRRYLIDELESEIIRYYDAE